VGEVLSAIASENSDRNRVRSCSAPIPDYQLEAVNLLANAPFRQFGQISNEKHDPVEQFDEPPQKLGFAGSQGRVMKN
jgi:hypothetical protein